jgi:hypothetical protein
MVDPKNKSKGSKTKTGVSDVMNKHFEMYTQHESCSTLKHKNQQHQKVFLLGLGFRLFFVCLVCCGVAGQSITSEGGSQTLALDCFHTRRFMAVGRKQIH